jgi:hypothetical protein
MIPANQNPLSWLISEPRLQVKEAEGNVANVNHQVVLPYKPFAILAYDGVHIRWASAVRLNRRMP